MHLFSNKDMFIQERILKYIDYKNITPYKFCKELNFSMGYLDKRGAIGTDKYLKIIEYYKDLNPDWLLTGKGDMLKEQEHPSKEYPTHAAKVNILSNASEIYENRYTPIITIPIVEVSAAAGSGFFNPDYTTQIGEINLPMTMVQKRNGNYYCGRVNGESMSPTLLHQDYIIFRLMSPDEWIDIKDNEVYFIVDRFGVSYVKRLQNRLKEQRCIICKSDNVDKKNFHDFSVLDEDIAHLYHVEWRFSKDLSNINDTLFETIGDIKNRMDTLEKKITLIDKK